MRTDVASGTAPADPIAGTRAELSTDRPRWAERPNAGASFDVIVESADIDWRGLAGGCGTTVLHAGAALLAVLVYRHTQQSEFDLGISGAAQRQNGDARVVRLRLSDEASFPDVVAAIEAGDAPPGRSTNVWFGSVADASLPDPACELAVDLTARDGKLLLRFRCDASLFDARRIEELAAQYLALARCVVASPRSAIADHALITDAARKLLPDPTAVLEQPLHRPITEMILEWAERTPQAAAIISRTRCHRYAELDVASGRLARELLVQGVSPGHVVAITGPRGFAFVAAMLGVLRSGGVLLTLDPKLPRERRRTMLATAGARTLVRVCHPTDADDLAGTVATRVIVDASSGDVVDTTSPDHRPLPRLEPGDPAYVFFTSGSTGVPKAVKGRHAGLSHFLAWQRTEFGVGPGDRASQLTALSFDVLLRDTFLALTSGATLCIPDELDVLDPARVLTWMQEQGITTVHVVPSLARMWLQRVPAGVTLPRLKRVFFAGEPLTDVLVTRWRQAFPGDFEIVNLYGPTETTLAKCFRRVPRPPEAGVQSIGHTLPQTQALILNRRRQRCGLLEAGEIAIRTPFRTLGYFNDPEANARAFVRNPFRDDADDLVYLTGDSGRYRADGMLEILGRIDGQLKIRGVRIEPGEIEACLGHHPGVREAVVVGREDADGEKMLVAYVVPRDREADAPAAQAIAAYRQFLRERVPDNMVPAAFVRLDALPLNANGKVDKKALPAPQQQSAEHDASGGEAQDELEQALARAWRSLLKVERVGIEDNFFDIGGHSLLAVQLVQAIESDIGRSCPLGWLFQAPTIRGLASLLRDARGTTDEATVVPLQPRGASPALFCICGVYLYQALADRLAPDIPVYGIFLPYERTLLEQPTASNVLSVEAMAAGYVRAMRQQQPNGPYCLAGVSFGGVLAYEMAQQLRAAGQEVAFLAVLDTLLPHAAAKRWTKRLGEALHDIGLGAMVEPIWRGIRRVLGTRGREAADDARAIERRHIAAMRQAIYQQAAGRYEPRHYAGTAILARAHDRAFFEGGIADLSYGWGALVADLRIVDVPGDHLGILKEPHVEQLAAELGPPLRAAIAAAVVTEAESFGQAA